MQQRHEDFAHIPTSSAIRTQIGRALRKQYHLAEPLSESLLGLLEQLEIRVRHDVALERQYTGVEEALESMINLANTNRGETSATEAPSY
jgi:hypothetical protein